MKLSCHITSEDFARAQSLNMRPRPGIKWAGILIVATGLVIGIQQLIFPPGGVFTWAPFKILGPLAGIAIYFWVTLPRSTKNAYEQQKTLQEPFEVELTDEACLFLGSRGSVRIPWEGFHKYKMSDDMILVFESDAVMHVFPKRKRHADHLWRSTS